MDALTGIVYLDDAQVVALGATKRWVDTYGAGGHTALSIRSDRQASEQEVPIQ
jgi:Holliday junction resolvase RusA-like endonuclease